MKQFVIGVDIGGTQLRTVLADAEGRILTRVGGPTRAQRGPAPVIEDLKEMIKEVMGSASRDEMMGIGLSAPGPIDPWTGVIHNPPNLPGWEDVPLKEILEEEFQLRVHPGNDANLAALAERRFGAGRGSDNMIYMTVSTGIGGGIISGGQLLLGWRGLAGEVGHITLEPNGPLCGCGNHGCLESLAAGPAIAREARARIQGGARTSISDLVNGQVTDITAKIVAQAAQEGDGVAREIIERAGFYIGLGVANLLDLFNPELVVIGGGVSKAGELLFKPIRQTALQRAMPALAEGVSIVPAALGDDVSLLGAVALVLAESVSEEQ